MTLTQALGFTDLKLSEGHESDGCTYAPDLGIKRFCVMHDFLRRFKPIPAKDADKLFLEGIKSAGWYYYPVAYIYYLAVVIARKLGKYE